MLQAFSRSEDLPNFNCARVLPSGNTLRTPVIQHVGELRCEASDMSITVVLKQPLVPQAFPGHHSVAQAAARYNVA